jgi:adenine-specific DNA-methyltransferase
VIKYLGSKRRLVPVLRAIAAIVEARTALDLFTGTTRVAHGLRTNGVTVTAVDSARYADVLARTYVATVLDGRRSCAVADALADVAAAPPRPGYVTEVFCRTARFFRPENGERIDAVRDAIAERYRDTWLEPVLLTALLEAADRVDSTTGVQMAYLKQWADRADRPLSLRPPAIPAGPRGQAVWADARDAVERLGPFDLAYFDPPYNQHRYDTNYHVWETIVAWDAPAHYGVACKRADARRPGARSVFNDRRRMPGALAECIRTVDAGVLVVSCNDEGWVSVDDVVAMSAARGEAEVLAFDARRYVGAQIGIHNHVGDRVGTVRRLRNTEYLVVAGPLTARQRTAIRALAPGRTVRA